MIWLGKTQFIEVHWTELSFCEVVGPPVPWSSLELCWSTFVVPLSWPGNVAVANMCWEKYHTGLPSNTRCHRWWGIQPQINRKHWKVFMVNGNSFSSDLCTPISIVCQLRKRIIGGFGVMKLPLNQHFQRFLRHLPPTSSQIISFGWDSVNPRCVARKIAVALANSFASPTWLWPKTLKMHAAVGWRPVVEGLPNGPTKLASGFFLCVFFWKTERVLLRQNRVKLISVQNNNKNIQKPMKHSFGWQLQELLIINPPGKWHEHSQNIPFPRSSKALSLLFPQEGYVTSLEDSLVNEFHEKNSKHICEVFDRSTDWLVGLNLQIPWYEFLGVKQLGG